VVASRRRFADRVLDLKRRLGRSQMKTMEGDHMDADGIDGARRVAALLRQRRGELVAEFGRRRIGDDL
jgi:hypothetical protein